MWLSEDKIKGIKSRFKKEITGQRKSNGQVGLLVKADGILRVAKHLRGAEGCEFDYLTDVCGVHYPGRKKDLEVVYHLYSVKRRHRLRLVVQLYSASASLPSVTPVWSTADWHEREVYDLMGIIFRGHPNLVRILNHESLEGHPLRKDYPLRGDDKSHGPSLGIKESRKD